MLGPDGRFEFGLLNLIDDVYHVWAPSQLFVQKTTSQRCATMTAVKVTL